MTMKMLARERKTKPQLLDTVTAGSDLWQSGWTLSQLGVTYDTVAGRNDLSDDMKSLKEDVDDNDDMKTLKHDVDDLCAACRHW